MFENAKRKPQQVEEIDCVHAAGFLLWNVPWACTPECDLMNRAPLLFHWICLNDGDKLPETSIDAQLLLFLFYESITITVMMTSMNSGSFQRLSVFYTLGWCSSLLIQPLLQPCRTNIYPMSVNQTKVHYHFLLHISTHHLVILVLWLFFFSKKELRGIL